MCKELASAGEIRAAMPHPAADTTTSVLFDTGLSPEAMVTNASRLGLDLSGGGADDWPTLSKRALTGEGFEVIERRQPSLLAGGSILITGEVDRTTDFEHGRHGIASLMPPE